MNDAPPRVAANGLEIAYETFGDRADPPIVLVMGLGTQMLAWPDTFCEQLAGAGYFVVRFDNRDVGLSTHLHDVAPPSLLDIVLRRNPPYRVDDMADDVVGLLDALELRSVHLVGASMGGFIAQTVALRHPDRLRSLTLIMTSTGSRWVGRADPMVVYSLLRRRAVLDREGAIAAGVATFRLIGSRGYVFDEEYLRDLAGRSYDRAYDRAGYFRQLAAVAAQPDRSRDLATIAVPTLVVHGLSDPLVGVSGGRALARAIPGAKFVGYSGMGHNLPRELWPDLVTEIVTLAQRADRVPLSPRH